MNNSEAGVSVNYSQLTNQFVFTAKETGEGGRIEIAGGTLGAALFGAVDPENLPKDQKAYTAGQDAIFQATINGETMTFSRSSNTFEADGMTITFSGTFNNVERSEGEGPIKSEELAEEGFAQKAFVDGEDVTFTSKTDADTIVEAVKSMVEDYNKILTEVKKLYSDMPLKKSDGSKYDPLTDEERADLDEAAELVGKYEIVPAAVAQKAIPACNITFIVGGEMKQALSGYLSVLFEQNPKAVGGAMPGDDFYYAE